LIEGPENSKNDYFACKIVGESIESFQMVRFVYLNLIQEAVETEK
jgi:hypothetical protein